MSAMTAITAPTGLAVPAGLIPHAEGASTAGTGVYLRRWATILAAALVMVGSLSVVVPRLAQAEAAQGSARGDAAVVSAPTALVEHRVLPGDTLWDLAVLHSAGEDPRRTVDRIMQLNAMDAPALQVGEVVLLPNG